MTTYIQEIIGCKFAFLLKAADKSQSLPVQFTSTSLLGNEGFPKVVSALDYFNGKVLKHKTATTYECRTFNSNYKVIKTFITEHAGTNLTVP